jgi:hypothetical protein
VFWASSFPDPLGHRLNFRRFSVRAQRVPSSAGHAARRLSCADRGHFPLAAVRPHAPVGEAWTHLGRSVVLACGEVVLKCFLHAAQTKWQRERRAYTFLQGSGLPVPRLIASGQLHEGVPWLLVSRMPGQVAVDVLDTLTAAEQRQLFEAAGALLASLHTLPVDERLTQNPLAVAREAYPHRLADRIADYSRRSTQGAPRRAETLAVARAWALGSSPGRPSALVCAHGDFSPRNLLDLVERVHAPPGIRSRGTRARDLRARGCTGGS